MFLRFAIALFCIWGAAASASQIASARPPLEDSDNIESLQQATRARPHSAERWISLGLAYESAGNMEAAERDLLRAARVDRRYQPAWTLANFYFRRGRPDSFWPWAAHAAAFSYDDLRPLLRLADSVDPESVIPRLGSSQALLRAYLDYLIGENRWDAARRTAVLLSKLGDPADRPRIADFQRRFSRSK